MIMGQSCQGGESRSLTSLGQGAGSLSRTVASASTVAMSAATSTPAVEANWAAPSSVWKAQPSGRPTPTRPPVELQQLPVLNRITE